MRIGTENEEMNRELGNGQRIRKWNGTYSRDVQLSIVHGEAFSSMAGRAKVKICGAGSKIDGSKNWTKVRKLLLRYQYLHYVVLIKDNSTSSHFSKVFL